MGILKRVINSRRRLTVPATLATSVFMLAYWFPANLLWNQHQQISQVNAQIAALQQQERVLQAQAKSIDSKTALTNLARSQYQLVKPGQSLIQILDGKNTISLGVGSGDPGQQPLVSPTVGNSIPVVTVKPVAGKPNFISKFFQSLEFWR
jgi:cell division protein FtsB